MPPDLTKSLSPRETARKILWKHPCCPALPWWEEPSYKGEGRKEDEGLEGKREKGGKEEMKGKEGRR